MINIAIPPNLYQSLTIPALMIFPNIESYSTTNEIFPTSILGLSLEKDSDVSINF